MTMSNVKGYNIRYIYIMSRLRLTFSHKGKLKAHSGLRLAICAASEPPTAASVSHYATAHPPRDVMPTGLGS